MDRNFFFCFHRQHPCSFRLFRVFTIFLQLVSRSAGCLVPYHPRHQEQTNPSINHSSGNALCGSKPPSHCLTNKLQPLTFVLKIPSHPSCNSQSRQTKQCLLSECTPCKILFHLCMLRWWSQIKAVLSWLRGFGAGHFTLLSFSVCRYKSCIIRLTSNWF